MYRPDAGLKRETKRIIQFIDNNEDVCDIMINYVLKRIPKANGYIQDVTIIYRGPIEEMEDFKQLSFLYEDTDAMACYIASDDNIYIFLDKLQMVSAVIVEGDKHRNIIKLFAKLFIQILAHEIHHAIEHHELPSDELSKLLESMNNNDGSDQECEERVNNKAREFTEKHERKLFRKLRLI